VTAFAVTSGAPAGSPQLACCSATRARRKWHEAGSRTDVLQTLRWREMDSNRRSLVEFGNFVLAGVSFGVSQFSKGLSDRTCHERPAVLEIGRHPGRPETVIAELRSNAGSSCPPADQCIGVRLRQDGTREPSGATPDRAEQRPLGSSRRPAPSTAGLAHWCTLACEHITAYAVMYLRPGVFRDGPSGSPLDGPHETRRAEGAGRLRRATG